MLTSPVLEKQKKVTLSLVFVNFQSAWHLERSLESLKKEKSLLGEREIIVVNNDPKERALLHAIQKNYPFSLIENTKNTGFANAANLGANASQGEILGFINPDTLFTGNTLSFLEEAFRDESLGVIGPKLVDASGKEDRFDFGAEITLFSTLSRHLFFQIFSQKKEVRAQIEVDWVSGGALFVRKSIFSLVGGFDERFFLYFEDADFCKRVQESGYRIYKALKPRLIHLGGKSQVSFAAQKKHYYESQDQYFRKHRPGIEASTLFFLRNILYGK